MILSDFFRMRSKKAKITNYSLLGVTTIYMCCILYPNFLFSHTITYENYSIYSKVTLGDDALEIVKQTHKHLTSSEIYDSSVKHNIYICNNYNLYTFLAPFSRKAFACNYPLINNIFVAKCDFSKKEAYKNTGEADAYVRKIHELLAHEVTHTLIEKSLGYWKYRLLPTWKNEGYCEYIGYNRPFSLEEAQSYIHSHPDNNRPQVTYRKYYFAVSYLMEEGKMSFSEMTQANISMEEVLRTIAEK